MTKRARSLTPPAAGVGPNKPATSISRATEPTNISAHPAKRTHADVEFLPRKIASAANAAAADGHTPFSQLQAAMGPRLTTKTGQGDAVVFWMRMQDMRIRDNRAFGQASEYARQHGLPLIALFILSPQDYVAHDRSARRIDFTLRNLTHVKESLAELNIPLRVITHSPRNTLPERVVEILSEWNAARLFANIEHEVDELRRDIRVFLTKDGRGYTVYSPFLRSWLPHLTDNSDPLACAPRVESNDPTVRQHPIFGKFFNAAGPESVEGFELSGEDAKMMRLCWPAGEDAAHEILRRFLQTKARTSQFGAADPLALGASEPKAGLKDSRIGKYKDARDRVDADTTSRLSAYLSAGVISARECIRATLALSNHKQPKIDASRDTGIGRWVQELAWRDFYTHVLALFPRVSMGRPFQETFAKVSWETNEAHLQAWKDGRTGVPIVDAGMRQANKMGWMHNRLRMITAMYLVKDLMIDWRLGEKYFMETLIDGDLASNNGGWQWSASTGVDPVPYFRIFNPYTQSKKADPSGDYIRYFVPELGKVFGDEIHNPSPRLAEKLGYPTPLVKHDEARQRAIRRYKNPGDV
ncbi:DNA photolyase [Phanerochaete sordida]|uniref:DNA photolyase n=1 Tax=Phanerochaete sordida TaxID=48140 RepID=A0A9P3L8B2_9APHY|nr:DNA photolyase [Phanerochaete sordida]